MTFTKDMSDLTKVECRTFTKQNAIPEKSIMFTLTKVRCMT